MTILCTRCFRSTPEDRETCPDLAVLGCPEPVDVSDEKALVIRCIPCGKLRALPIGNVMKRTRLTELGVCQFDVCKAEIILPVRGSAPSALPPISEPVVPKRGKGK